MSSGADNYLSNPSVDYDISKIMVKNVLLNILIWQKMLEIQIWLVIF
jgi:hypothetical protein